MAQAVQENLARLAEEMRPYETGATYVNFLELGGADSGTNTDAAYSPEDWERLVGAQGSLRPRKSLPLQPQHPALFGEGVRGSKEPLTPSTAGGGTVRLVLRPLEKLLKRSMCHRRTLFTRVGGMGCSANFAFTEF